MSTPTTDPLNYDLIIIGAGPGGSAAALGLVNSGKKVALLDKASFPRDKICGDFIAGHGIRALKALSPNAYDRLIQFPEKAANKSTDLFIGQQKAMRFHWKMQSYTLRRTDFDNLLVEEVKSSGKIDLYEAHVVKKITREGTGFLLQCANGQLFRCKMLIGADGAHSVVARQLAGFKIDREHYGGSVRAYFTGVQDIEAAVNEVYVHKDVLPGYFWLFPLGPDSANVGLGMHSRHITKRKVDLKALFYQLIQEHPVLQAKLGKAQQEGDLQGFGLPFYSREQRIHGDGYMLVGDAASLIDPSNGEGIMLAIVSGQLAAQQALTAFAQNDWSEAGLEPYFQAVHKRWWKEMRTKAFLVNTFAHRAKFLYAVGALGNRFPFIQRSLQKLM